MVNSMFVLSVLLSGMILACCHLLPPFPSEDRGIQNISFILPYLENSEIDSRSGLMASKSSSFGRSTVNTNILTLFHYNGSQIYVYNSVANDVNTAITPHKWIFYYVPIMAPITAENSPWVWAVKTEVRVKLLIGDSLAEEMARKAIEKKYDLKTAEYSKYWDIAPLMIDSLTAYVTEGSDSPVPGVQPYQAVHPNSLVMIFRFKCSTEEQAHQIAGMLKEGEYEIEIAFHFAGFHETATNFVTLTGDQMKAVSSKTTADGGNTNAEYIHRSQASKFVSLYNTNVQKIIYIESADFNHETILNGMQETFISLMQQAMDELVQTKLDAQAYEKIWNSSDLNPNRITSELNQIFTYNKTATEAHHDGSNYFDINWEKLRKSSQSTNVGLFGKIAASLLDIISVGASFGLNVGHQSSSETLDTYQHIGYQTVSDKYIYDSLQKHDIRVEWTGEKLQPKSFDVFKINELSDRLQTALVSKQMIIERNKSAIIRVVSTINTPQSIMANPTRVNQFLTGEIKLYTGVHTPPLPWLLCNGSTVSRIQYQRLFAVVGERYGSGDGVNTFTLPDFRGRMPLGVDPLEIRVKSATEIGVTGGNSTYQLKASEIPAHKHSQGSLYVSPSGSHTHSISDPGHDHGGRTGDSIMGNGGWGMKGPGHGSDQARHGHSIQRDYTRITVLPVGEHSHAVHGETGLFGNGQAFTVIPPYQTVNYIIYAD